MQPLQAFDNDSISISEVKVSPPPLPRLPPSGCFRGDGLSEWAPSQLSEHTTSWSFPTRVCGTRFHSGLISGPAGHLLSGFMAGRRRRRPLLTWRKRGRWVRGRGRLALPILINVCGLNFYLQLRSPFLTRVSQKEKALS